MTHGLEDLLFITIVLPAVAVGFIASLFGLSRILSPDGLQCISSRLRSWRMTLSQVMIVVVATALFVNMVASPYRGHGVFAVILLSLWVLAWFVRSWRKEFVFLMGLRDDDLPGRHDKLIWAVVLLAVAPVGVWLFRSYRLAHWPEPKSVIHGEFGPEPAGRGRAAQPV